MYCRLSLSFFNLHAKYSKTFYRYTVFGNSVCTIRMLTLYLTQSHCRSAFCIYCTIYRLVALILSHYFSHTYPSIFTCFSICRNKTIIESQKYALCIHTIEKGATIPIAFTIFSPISFVSSKIHKHLVFKSIRLCLRVPLNLNFTSFHFSFEQHQLQQQRITK